MKYAIVFWSVAGLCVMKAFGTGGWELVLYWPALSFATAGCAYAGVGPRVFGKREDGRLSPITVFLLFPYLIYTWAVWHLWRLSTREPPFHELCDSLTIGRRLLPGELPSQVTKVFDLTCEFPEPSLIRTKVLYRCLPTLDARPPAVAALRQVAEEVLNTGGGVYIHCANGHGRTGTLAGAVLLVGGKVRTSREAIDYIQRCRPKLTLNSTQRFALMELEATIAQEDEKGRSNNTMEPTG